MIQIDTDSYKILGQKYGLPSQKCGMYVFYQLSPVSQHPKIIPGKMMGTKCLLVSRLQMLNVSRQQMLNVVLHFAVANVDCLPHYFAASAPPIHDGQQAGRPRLQDRVQGRPPAQQAR